MCHVREQTIAYLEQHQVMTLATSDGSDLWAAAVFYVNDKLSFYFLSASHTRHAQHIAANPWIAATVQEDYADWKDIKGVQLEGPVHRLQGDARQQAMELYHAKYPFVSGVVGQLAAALAQMNWYQIIPARLYFIDNSKGLGHREEISGLPL